MKCDKHTILNNTCWKTKVLRNEYRQPSGLCDVSVKAVRKSNKVVDDHYFGHKPVLLWVQALCNV